MELDRLRVQTYLPPSRDRTLSDVFFNVWIYCLPSVVSVYLILIWIMNSYMFMLIDYISYLLCNFWVMLHFSLYLIHTINKTEFSLLYFGLVALEGSTITRHFIITTAGVNYCLEAVKCHPNFIAVLLYFFWSFGNNDCNTFSIVSLENWIPLTPVLGGVSDVAHFIIFQEQTQ